jgi:hypothetical protein
MAAGMTEYVAKPYDKRALLSLMERLLVGPAEDADAGTVTAASPSLTGL